MLPDGADGQTSQNQKVGCAVALTKAQWRTNTGSNKFLLAFLGNRAAALEVLNLSSIDRTSSKLKGSSRAPCTPCKTCLRICVASWAIMRLRSASPSTVHCALLIKSSVITARGWCMLVREPLLSERAKEMGSLGLAKERCDKGISLSFTLGPKPGMPLNGFAAFVRQQGQQVELFIKTNFCSQAQRSPSQSAVSS